MNKKTKRINALLLVFLVGILTASTHQMVNDNTSFSNYDNKNQDSEENANNINNPLQNSAGSADPIISQGGGYSTKYVSKYDVFESAQSSIQNRSFQAIAGNKFNISTPSNWNIQNFTLDLETYQKNQTVKDSTFDTPQGTNWNSLKNKNANGDFSFDWLPSSSNPDYVRTTVAYTPILFPQTAFLKGDYGLYSQNMRNLNPKNFDIARGKVYQAKNQTIQNYDFTADPNFMQDYNNPYGGTTKSGDSVNLEYKSDGYLRVDIVPSTSIFRGNPSAAWWYYLDIRYEAENAFMTISWEIDADSNFESNDDYRVCARINNKYINGKTDFISQTGQEPVPNQGSDTALQVYNTTTFLRHGIISRTYNITRLIDKTVGINKFDFGAWAKNPSQGDADDLIVNFYSLEIKYNTTDKYEIATLEFIYKAIDKKGTLPGSGDNLGDPNGILNNFSLYLVLDTTNYLRIVPFNKMTISTSSFGNTPYIPVTYCIPQQYMNLLKSNNLNFSIGVVFEYAYYRTIQLELYFDDVSLKINYKHPNVNYTQLEMKQDMKSWTRIYTNSLNVNTTGWIAGLNHGFQFRTQNSTFNTLLYVNIGSKLNLNLTRSTPNGAWAFYKINTANSDTGIWNITYNNTFSYNPLKLLNGTQYFNLSKYSISYRNLPAFDNNGSNSKNWEIFKAVSPNFKDYTTSLSRFNYTTPDKTNQSAKIEGAFKLGNWTIQAHQINYVRGYTTNASSSLLGDPIFYRGSTMKYNFSLYQDFINDYDGYYNISVLNSSGHVISGFPQFLSSDKKYLEGNIDITLSYSVGNYYLSVKWNDTNNSPGKTVRFGSNIFLFRVYNATNVGFIYEQPSLVTPGQLANYTVYYRTNFTNWGINTTLIYVYENSTGSWVRWGVAWSGFYRVSTVYLGGGNYSLKLITTGAPTRTYKLLFAFLKLYHQSQNLTSILNVESSSRLNVTVISGAYYDSDLDGYIISQDNIPFVNDTITSIIQFNLTNYDKPNEAIWDGTIIGVIGESGNYFEAINLYELIPLPQYKGLYNLTLDTTGLNATENGQNKTLNIFCSTVGFVSLKINITIFIVKIPTEVTLQNINDVYEGEEISVLAIMKNYITPSNPFYNDQGVLTYFLYQGPTLEKTGQLDLVANGVYTDQIDLTGLDAGNYTIYVNGSAFNCKEDQSSNKTFNIMPQNASEIIIGVPDMIRVLNDFDIQITLRYQNNASGIPYQNLKLNITLAGVDSYPIEMTTNQLGVAIHKNFIIAAEYEGDKITLNATYNGQSNIGASKKGVEKIISGKIPITLNITSHPNNAARVGYQASYRVQIDIEDPEESVQNQIILFSAYYENEIDNPFVSFQLQTDLNGECGYTISEIADGKDNLTVYFEYLGSTTITYNSTNRTDTILPKWSSRFTFEDLPEVIRFGQTIEYDMNFYCDENSSIFFRGIGVIFTFAYGGIIERYTQYVDNNTNTLLFSYKIADEFEGDLNYTIFFLGTTKINSTSYSRILVIEEKIEVTIEFLDSLDSQYLVGEHYISILVTDGNDEPLKNLELIFELLDANGEIVDSVTTSSNNKGIASVSLDFSKVGEKFSIKVYFLEEGIYAGSELVSEDIRIVNEFMLFLDVLPYILIATAIIAAVSLSIYRGIIIPKRNRQREFLKQMYQKLSDAENMQYFLILTAEGGVPVFSKSLTEVPIDESLVSGFLSAISTFGQEIGAKMKDKDTKEGLEELSYGQFKIILETGIYVRTALLLKKKSSASLKSKLKSFTQEFEKTFDEKLKNFRGEQFEDAPVTRIIEEIFEADLLYPHQIVASKTKEYIKNLPRKDLSKKILVIAKSGDIESQFYLRDLINHLKTKGIEEIKSFECIQTLKTKQIIFAINPRTSYLIDQLQPYITLLEDEDKKVLFVLFDGVTDEIGISKALKKQNIKTVKNIDTILSKLKKMKLIEGDNHLNNTGSAVATLLKLIPGL